jgi:photosynthetic reaction center cytochrome c subunit
MFRLNSIPALALAGGLVAALVCLLTFQRPPVDVIQTGPDGVGMQVLYNPASVQKALGINKPPTVIPQIDAGPAAGKVYKNIQVLSNVSAGAFGRLMISMTQWVAPAQGCGYCHVTGNFASDAKYTKIVARRMLQMTIAVNTQYTNHVQGVGVTCYTCHRGQNNPSNIWFKGVQPGSAPGLAEMDMGKNLPSAGVNGSSLPADPYTPFLLNNDQIRVVGDTALPEGKNPASVKNTEWTYALMMTYAQGLGVSCEFCHNSRAINEWDESTPQRVTAFYAEAMLRDLNSNYMVPLTSVFPAVLRGPSGDVAKVDCATCHNGVYQPLFGAKMADQFPALEGKGTAPLPATPPPTTDAWMSPTAGLAPAAAMAPAK